MNQRLVKNRYYFFHGYWILLVGFLCLGISNGFGSYAFSLYVLPLNGEFYWSRGTVMIGFFIWSIISGLASPFVGKIIQRWDAKSVIAAGALIMGIGFVLLSQVHTLWHFYLLYAFIGAGAAATGAVPISTVVSYWFNKHRGLALGIVGSGFGVGGFVIPGILGNYIIPNFGWRISYLFSGIVSTAVIIPLSLWLIKTKPEEIGFLQDGSVEIVKDNLPLAKNPDALAVQLNQVLKIPAFWLMGIGFVTFGVASSIIFQNQVPHLQDIGFTAIQAVISIQALGIGSAIGKFAFGWLGDYIRPKYILIIGCIIQAIALFILMTITSSSPLLLLWFYGILVGLSYGSWLPAISMNTTYHFGILAYSVIFGIYNFVYMAASAIGPVIGGSIYDITGSYYLMFFLCFALYVVSVLSMLLVRRPNLKR